MRICFIDNPRARGWSDVGNRFASLAGDASSDDQYFFCEPPAAAAVNYLAGCARESDAEPLLAAARVVDAAKRADADLTIFPLRGGLAHGLLMARACGEFPSDRRIAIWCDAPTRSTFLASDLTAPTLAPLVADALERASLELADALIVPDAQRLDELKTLGVELPPAIICPTAPETAAISRAEPVTRLVFIGALSRCAGAAAFIDALEHLALNKGLDGLEIVFAGPVDDPPFAPGKTWLGLRASRWRFPFRVVETQSLKEALGVASQPGALGIMLTHDVEDLPFAETARLLRVPLGPSRVNDLGASIARAISEHLAGSEVPAMTRPDWSQAIAEIRALPLRAPGAPQDKVSLSICTVHFERPALLEKAIDSIAAEAGDGVEIVIVDNGSTSAESHAMLDRLAARAHTRVLRLSEPRPYPVAYNHAVTFARNEFLVFLDDDNAFTQGGLARLRRACAMRRFDVIVSNLELFDHGAEGAPAPGVMTFIGPARSAGLFFNAFGDTCLAFRREAFVAMGGFRDSVAAYPGADWVLLSRAQAAGLKIGVLQEPAYRYRRDPERAGANWQKYDQYGVRSLVIDGYGDAYDETMIAKFAQGLWMANS